MAYKLQLKRGASGSLPTGSAGEPLFTTDTNDLYIGTGAANQRFQKYIASGTSSQFLKGDGSLDSNTYYLASNPSAYIALTALTASAPLSYNNTTGAFTIAQASGSVNGFLSSTDWTTFNNKQNTITNPVTGTGTTNYLPKFTGTSTIGNSQIFDNGTNVGINQPSPTRTLDILGASGVGTVLKLQGASGTTTYLQMAYNGATNAQSGYIGYNSSSQMQFFTNDTVALTIDSNRNLGLGVTPSDWFVVFKALQIGNYGAAISGQTNDQALTLWSNAYPNASNVETYTTNNAAAKFRMESGAYKWFTAGAGTGAITFTQAMTLFANGGLGLNTTTPTTSTGYTTFSTNGSTGGQIEFQTSGVGKAYIYSNSTDLRFYTNGGAFRFENTTGLEVGYSSAIGLYKLDVNGTGRFMVSSTSQNQLRVYSSDATATLRTYSTSDGDGLILNQYYAVAGSPYLRSADFVASMGDIASTQMRFFTKAASSNPAVALTIASTGAATFSSGIATNGYTASTSYAALFNGSVGIGTSSPIDKLHIVGGLTSTSIAVPSNPSVGSLQIGYDGTNGIIRTWNSSPLITSTYNYQAFETSGAERMRITSGGDIRITSAGTTNAATLELTSDATPSNGSLIAVSYLGSGSYGPLRFGTGGSERMRITSGGNVLIGTTTVSGSAILQVTGAATFSSSVTATSFFESSDSRLKTLIQDNYQTKGIASITPKLYTKNGKVELGYYAQDFIGVLDSAVSKGSDEMLSLSYREVLVAKVYALEQEIKELKAK